MRKVLRPVAESIKGRETSAGGGRVQAQGCVPKGQVEEGNWDMRLP
jgi:hypothetical protein